MAPGGASGQGHADVRVRCDSEVRKGQVLGEACKRGGQTGLFIRQRGRGGGLGYRTIWGLK